MICAPVKSHLQGPYISVYPPYLTLSPCSYLHWLSDLFFITQQNVPLSPSGPLPIYHTKLSHLHTRGQAIFALSNPLEILLSSFPSTFLLLSFITAAIYLFHAKRTWYYLVSPHYQSWNSHSPIFTYIVYTINILLIEFKGLPPISYILGTCHRAFLLTLLYTFSESMKPI